MIFITVGTTQYPFFRLIDWVIVQAKLFPREKFIMQSGAYKVDREVPSNLVVKQWFSFPEIQEFIKEATVVICHAGTGTMIQCWSHGKKPLVVPRLGKYREHVNDHQSRMVEYLIKKDKIIVLDTELNLDRKMIKKKRLNIKTNLEAKRKLINYLATIC